MSPHAASGDELERARSLVLQHGWNATSYQILNPGIARWFAAAGDAVVGFVRHGRARVVAGAPVCAEPRLGDVVAEFERDAAATRETVCYFGAETRLERVCRSSGHHALVLLGAQPVWQPSQWAAIVEGKASLRAQLHRARNKGVRVREMDAAQAQGNAALRRCLTQWLATRGLPALHFLVEPETLERVLDRRVFAAEREDEALAFLVASPVPQRNGWLIEQVVRGQGAPNGTTELLIDAAVRAMAAAGSSYVTLGLSPLSRRGGVPARDDPWWLRIVLGWVRAHGRRFYDFEGLDAFKAKFRPQVWEKVYAISNEPRFSIRALYAIAGAFSRGSPLWLIARAGARAVRTELRWLWARRRKTKPAKW